MGKRSNFDRIEKDFYKTIDPKASEVISNFLPKGFRFAEPCVGEGDLKIALENKGLQCSYSSDLPTDALSLSTLDCDGIITNPPWSRHILHPMIEHFVTIAPCAWLLFDSSWAYTRQAKKYLELCTDIIVVGRLLWIPGTTMKGKDDCSWYRFSTDRIAQTRFWYH